MTLEFDLPESFDITDYSSLQHHFVWFSGSPTVLHILLLLWPLLLRLHCWFFLMSITIMYCCTPVLRPHASLFYLCSLTWWFSQFMPLIIIYMLMTPKLTSAADSYALIYRFLCPATYPRFILWHRMDITNLMCPKLNPWYPSHKLPYHSKWKLHFSSCSAPQILSYLWLLSFSHIWHLSVNTVSTNFNIHLEFYSSLLPPLLLS